MSKFSPFLQKKKKNSTTLPWWCFPSIHLFIVYCILAKIIINRLLEKIKLIQSLCASMYPPHPADMVVVLSRHQSTHVNNRSLTHYDDPLWQLNQILYTETDRVARKIPHAMICITNHGGVYNKIWIESNRTATVDQWTSTGDTGRDVCRVLFWIGTSVS